SMNYSEQPVEFVDLKKFGVKESFNIPNSYDNKEFKPHSAESNSSSVKYEFVVFISETESSSDIKAIEGGLIFLDKNRFKSMGLSLLKGDPYAVFNNDFNILISDRIARAYFGEEDPVDKILILDGKYSVLVKGVYKSKNDSLPLGFDFIAGPVTNEKINQR
uniref:ABC transporter permease n=1 Tax=Aquiflexum sp. TaxID=1872584 RepID=UPI003593813D